MKQTTHHPNTTIAGRCGVQAGGHHLRALRATLYALIASCCAADSPKYNQIHLIMFPGGEGDERMNPKLMEITEPVVMKGRASRTAFTTITDECRVENCNAEHCDGIRCKKCLTGSGLDAAEDPMKAADECKPCQIDHCAECEKVPEGEDDNEDGSEDDSEDDSEDEDDKPEFVCKKCGREVRNTMALREQIVSFKLAKDGTCKEEGLEGGDKAFIIFFWVMAGVLATSTLIFVIYYNLPTRGDTSVSLEPIEECEDEGKTSKEGEVQLEDSTPHSGVKPLRK